MTESLTRTDAADRSPSLRVRTLGGLSVERDGVPLEGLNAQRKRLALLALLSAAGSGGLPRDKVLALLWPESTDDQARNALNQSVFGLRRELGADAIAVGTELRLNSALVRNDVSEFRQAIEAGEFETAVALYGGPFLDGFGLKAAREFEMWADEVRRGLGGNHAGALEALADRSAKNGDTKAAVVWWRRRAEVEPLSARVARELMGALVANGEREAALQHAAVYTALIRTELDAEPDASITELVAQLRNGGATARIPPDASRERALSDAARAAPPAAAAATTPAAVDQKTRTGKRRWLLGAAVAICAVAPTLFLVAPTSGKQLSLSSVLTNLLQTLRGSQPLDTLPRVQITKFQNRTGDAALDQLGETMADWIGQGVVETGLVDVVPAHTALLRARGENGDADTTPSNGAAIAKLTGAGLVVTGNYYRRHDSVFVESSLIDAKTGRLLGSPPSVALDVGDPYPAIVRVRQRIMGLLAAAADPRLQQWAAAASQPTTFDAYREFSDGVNAFVRHDLRAALPHFERARQLDTNFVLPALWSLFVYGDARRREADSVVSYLESRRDRLTEWDRAMLDYQRAGLDHVPLEQYAAIQNMVRLTPGSAWLFQAAALAVSVDRPQDAVDDLLKLDPSGLDWWIDYWGLLNRAYHMLGQFDRALAAANEIQQRRPDRKELVTMLRATAFGAIGNVEQVERVIAADSTAPADRLPFFSTAIQEAAVHGHRATASRLIDTFDSTLAQLTPSEQREPHMQELRGSALLAAGRVPDALAIGRTISSPMLVALSSAVLGDRRTADSAVAILFAQPRAPRDLLPRVTQLRVAAILGDRSRAQQLLRDFLRDGRWWQALHREPGAAAMRGYPAYALLVGGR